MSNQIKAYAVTESFEDTGGIVFARHAVTARRVGACEYADSDFSNVSCRRAPWADHCADTGIVPASLMVECGWHFECFGCGRRIDSDLPDAWENESYDAPARELVLARRRYRKWKPSHVIGTQHSAVFCDQQCKDDHDADEAERKRRQDHAIGVFKRKVLKRFPGVQFCDDGWSKPHAYATKENGRWRVKQVAVSFEFPGMKHGPANYRWDAPSTYRKAEKAHFTCCTGDREAFESWATMVSQA